MPNCASVSMTCPASRASSSGSAACRSSRVERVEQIERRQFVVFARDRGERRGTCPSSALLHASGGRGGARAVDDLRRGRRGLGFRLRVRCERQLGFALRPRSQLCARGERSGFAAIERSRLRFAPVTRSAIELRLQGLALLRACILPGAEAASRLLRQLTQPAAALRLGADPS